MSSSVSMEERFEAAMVLAGAGDAIGYCNGEWEFCHSGKRIYSELNKLGGLDHIQVKLPKWMVSDDTVMLLATGEALCETAESGDREQMFLKIAEKYKECMRDMAGRAPGGTCMSSVHHLKPWLKKGYLIPFNSRGGGCGAAMRSMCIGLLYPRPGDLESLVALSVESGRMTHHLPTGYLGSLASALFTALAVQGRPLPEWGRCLLDTLPLAWSYISQSGHEVQENRKHWDFFGKEWTRYLQARNILDGKGEPQVPSTVDFDAQDVFYKSLSYSGWGGSSGHDAPMIAYDALLGANWDWHELCKRAMFHGGDSDSTGVIAACCYGAAKGFQGVPPGNYKNLEYQDRLAKVGLTLLEMSGMKEAQQQQQPGDVTVSAS